MSIDPDAKVRNSAATLVTSRTDCIFNLSVTESAGLYVPKATY